MPEQPSWTLELWSLRATTTKPEHQNQRVCALQWRSHVLQLRPNTAKQINNWEKNSQRHGFNPWTASCQKVFCPCFPVSVSLTSFIIFPLFCSQSMCSPKHTIKIEIRNNYLSSSFPWSQWMKYLCCYQWSNSELLTWITSPTYLLKHVAS